MTTLTTTPKFHKIKPPEIGETLVPYYTGARDAMLRHLGYVPARSSLFVYLEKGFPVVLRRTHRHTVQVPHLKLANKRVVTSLEAMERMMKVVKSLQKQNGVFVPPLQK
ncbi:MAG: hypothetical protein IT442_04995 [Phycisphaeraceae bacterium]|nr:hypothetical protein [Phycisphaeraceae bacterium]